MFVPPRVFAAPDELGDAAAAAEVVMIVHGEDKPRASRRLVDAERYQPDWPATVLADCRSPHLFVDRTAYPSGAFAAATG